MAERGAQVARETVAPERNGGAKAWSDVAPASMCGPPARGSGEPSVSALPRGRRVGVPGCVTKSCLPGVGLGSEGEKPETKPSAGLVPQRHEAGAAPGLVPPLVAAGRRGAPDPSLRSLSSRSLCVYWSLCPNPPFLIRTQSY